MIRLLLPESLSPNKFIKDQSLFFRLLAKQGNDATWYCKSFQSFSPYPVAVEKDDYLSQLRLQKLLHKAMVGIVTNFFSDKRLQALYAFPDEVSDLLRSVHHLDYRPGSYRPDLLYDTDGNFKICEINARFPTNGYFITQYIANIKPELSYLLDSDQSEGECLSLPEAQEPFLRKFPEGSKVFILKDREKGMDIHFFNYELNKRGYDCRIINRSDTDQLTTDSCLVLELHQDELLDEQNRSTIKRLITQCQYFNDLRTIFIVHDKRFLAVLSREDIIADYLDKDEAKWLGRHVIPTFAIRDSLPQVADALKNKENWVLKPNLLGKAQGIVFGKSVPMEDWSEALRKTFYSEWVLQHYIEQEKFPVLTLEDGKISTAEMNLIGTLLCFDDLFLGPGIYRAVTEEILTVAHGGAVLFPIVTS